MNPFKQCLESINEKNNFKTAGFYGLCNYESIRVQTGYFMFQVTLMNLYKFTQIFVRDDSTKPPMTLEYF